MAIVSSVSAGRIGMVLLIIEGLGDGQGESIAENEGGWTLPWFCFLHAPDNG